MHLWKSTCFPCALFCFTIQKALIESIIYCSVLHITTSNHIESSLLFCYYICLHSTSSLLLAWVPDPFARRESKIVLIVSTWHLLDNKITPHKSIAVLFHFLSEKLNNVGGNLSKRRRKRVIVGEGRYKTQRFLYYMYCTLSVHEVSLFKRRIFIRHEPLLIVSTFLSGPLLQEY